MEWGGTKSDIWPISLLLVNNDGTRCVLMCGMCGDDVCKW